MSKIKSIRHMLRNESYWNPFSDSFDDEKVAQDLKNYLEVCNTNEDYEYCDDQKALTIVSKGWLFHHIFMQIYKYMLDAIGQTKAHPEQIIKFLIAIGNVDTIDINEYMEEAIKDFDGVHLEEVVSISIQPKEGSPSINAIGAFEMQIDLLNNLLNYLRYFVDKKELHSNYDQKQIEKIASYLYSSSNMYFVVKDSYDRITWEDGEIIESPENVLHLNLKSEEYLKLLKVGQHRIERNITAAIVETHAIFNERPELQSMLNLERKKAVISSVAVDHRGFVTVKVAKINDYPPNEEMIAGFSAIISLYPHIHLDPLKGLQRMTIRDMLLLYSQLTSLATALREHLGQKELSENKDLKRFFIRIKKKDFLTYFQSVTNFSKAQIESFLSIIENDLYTTANRKRINLWSRPILKSRDVYFLLLASLQAPNYLQLIDEWLESAGYSLKERGTALEKYLKETSLTHLKDKGKYVIIPEKQKFYSSKKQYEEIDLIISMEKMIFIAEVKNIKFPMEARDFHNGYKRLKEGADQIKRKSEFLLKNSSVFESELGGIEGKSIHIAVICNYSHFTGMEIEGVPIIDYMALQSYLNEGELKDLKVEFEEGNQMTEIIEVTRLWNNIDEFYENFSSYLKLPTVVQKILKTVSIDESQITPPNATNKMLMQTAVFSSNQNEQSFNS